MLDPDTIQDPVAILSIPMQRRTQGGGGGNEKVQIAEEPMPFFLRW